MYVIQNVINYLLSDVKLVDSFSRYSKTSKRSTITMFQTIVVNWLAVIAKLTE